MPKLIIIAGCNGAGKSTYAPSLLPADIISFDYDKLLLENYNALPDSEFREKIAKDKTTKAFEKAIAYSLKQNQNFCYETNFDTFPIYWAIKFKEKGFIEFNESNPSKIERALFAFHNFYFLNDNSNWKNRFEFADFNEAKKLAEKLFENSN